MTDQKLISDIFNDFMSLYLGKENVGIKQLCKKYDNHPTLLALLSNLDEATKVPVPQVMMETYQVYKKYRDRELEDEDWKVIVDTTRDISQKWKDNKWCNHVILALLCLLDADEKERKQIATEVEKEMEKAMQAENDAA